MWQFNGELKWPLVPRIFTRAAPFYDIGNAWADFSPFSMNKFEEEARRLNSSVGVGVRLTIPNTIIVVRVDYGWPMTDYIPGQPKSGRLHFNIGNIF
jgi:hypothetical protein